MPSVPWRRRPRLRITGTEAIKWAWAPARLLGAGKYDYDIAARWHLLGDDSTAIAALDLLSLMMIDAIVLLPVVFAPVVSPDAFRAWRPRPRLQATRIARGVSGPRWLA